MENSKFSKSDLIDILIKKASGFYYTEEQYEYEKTQKKSVLTENHSSNLSFFDNFDRGEQQNQNCNDTIIVSNEKVQSDEYNNKNLTLIKKKVATHYVSPDINAIKILFEIFENKVGQNEIETLTDNELIKLKNNLIKELFNEYSENK